MYHGEPEVVSQYLVAARGMLGGIIFSLGSDNCLVSYSKGYVEGDVSCHDADGKKTIEFHLTDGKLDGQAAIYDHGDIRSRLHWSKGRADGNQALYSASGDVSHEWNEADGKKVGSETYRTPDGKTIANGSWDEGKFTGTQFDGHLSVYTLDDGVKDGPFKVYKDAPGGELSIEGSYNDGIPSGKWVYHERDRLLTELTGGTFEGQSVPEGILELLQQDYVDSVAVHRSKEGLDGQIEGMDKTGKVVVSFSFADGAIQPPVLRFSSTNDTKLSYTEPEILQALNHHLSRGPAIANWALTPEQRKAEEDLDNQRDKRIKDVISMRSPRAGDEMQQSYVVPASAQPTDAQCVDQWVDAFHRENGQDAAVSADQLDEWSEWCKEGRHAPTS